MNRFARLFTRRDRRMFVPFFTLGDPNAIASFDLICAAVDAGADAVELGFPFSDPITDGPVNQRSMRRALAAGTTYATCLDMLQRLRERYPALPIGLLLYYNLLFMRGERAYKELAAIGVDAVVCSDLPFEECATHMWQLADSRIGCIQMVAPNTPVERARKLIDSSSAFTYVISRFGTTGTSASFEQQALARIEHLSKLADKAIVAGFGISTVDQVRDFWAAGANGVIVGSLFSLQIERCLADVPAARQFIEAFVGQVQAGKPRLDFAGIV
ncbi:MULTISPECIES: tryptophan synthase subunit alpha [Cupriavidus]